MKFTFTIDNPPTADEIAAAKTTAIIRNIVNMVVSVGVLAGGIWFLPFVFKAVAASAQWLIDIEMWALGVTVSVLCGVLFLLIGILLVAWILHSARGGEFLKDYEPVSSPDMEEILTLAADHPEIERYRAAVAQMKREFFVSDLVTMRDFVTAKAAQVEAEKEQMEIDALKSQLYRASN